MESKLELVSLSDVARIADTTKQAVNNWRKRYKTFPEPVQNLKSGPVWSREQIEAWIKTIDTKERPKKLKIKPEAEKSLENWLWDAACAIRGAQDAPKFKDYILPLVFVKRLCDVFDDEVKRLATEFGSRKLVLKLLEKDRKLVRFYLPFRPADPEKDPTWNAIKLLTSTSTKSLGQQLTDLMHAIAKENPRLNRIVNRIDYNNTTHGVRELPDDRIEILINRLSGKRLGFADVEPDIIGRSYEYLIRKFAEGGGQSAGEFFTPTEVGFVMARLLDPEPGMTGYDPNTGSAGLIIKMQLILEEKAKINNWKTYAPLKLFGQEYLPMNWAMANMNMVIHEMEGEIEIGDTMKAPKLLREDKKGLMRFDRITSNPMWNQNVFTKDDYEKDEYDRFGNRIPPPSSADWGWMQHILASLKDNGRAAVVLDTGAASRGSGSDGKGAEKEIRKWFVEEDYIEGVIYLPDNLFYNTPAPGIVIFLSKIKPAHLKNKLILVNASRCYTKGNPKNFVDADSQKDIVDAYQHFLLSPNPENSTFQVRENRGGAALIMKDVIVNNDYNISPTKYISIGVQEVLLPVPEIIQQLKTSNLNNKGLYTAVETLFESLLKINGSKNRQTEKASTRWEPALVGDFFDIQQGKQLSAANRIGNNKKKFLRTSNIFWGRVDLTNLDEMHFSESDETKLELKENDLLVCEGGDIGRTAICREDLPGVYFQNHIHRLRPKNGEVNPEFFMYWMWFAWTLTDYYVGAGNKTTIPNLSKAKLGGLQFPKPSREEQLKIARIFSTIQEAIQKHEEMLNTMRALKNSLMKDVMTGSTSVHNIHFDSKVAPIMHIGQAINTVAE